jgi:ActR/RegA family two-component response regulator
MLNWDAGNAVMRGELDAFPGGWNALPKDRLHHWHVRNAVKDATGKTASQTSRRLWVHQRGFCTPKRDSRH